MKGKTMFNNYLKTAIRNMKKYTGFTLINLFGLTVGLTAFMLIALFVRYELSFDRYHEHADRIYQMPYTPLPLASALMEECPEVVSAARVWSWGESGERLFSNGETHFQEVVHYADPEIFNIFSMPLLYGDPETALNDPFSIILSRKVAERYFGDENPLGKVLTVSQSGDWRLGDNRDYTITGVFENIPANSHFVMDMIVPFKSLIAVNLVKNLWKDNNSITYLLLSRGSDPGKAEKTISSIVRKYKYPHVEEANDAGVRFPLRPLTSIHLDKDAVLHFTSYYDIKYIYLYASIAVLILIVACINYINLTTARSIKRSKEVGIRKVIGAGKAQLIRQFLSESFLLITAATVLSLILVRLFLPYYSSMIGRPLQFIPAENSHLTLGIIAVLVFMGVICGGYPAFYLSSIRPVFILSGKSTGTSRGLSLRNILVIAQFTITSILIISMLVVKNQLHFIQNKNLGFSKEQVIFSKIEHNVALRNNIVPVKAELEKNPNILAVCCSGTLPNNIRWRHTHGGLRSKTSGKFFPFYVGLVDYDFIDVFGIDIVEGRNFSRHFPSEMESAVIINEKAANACEWDSPLGKEFRMRNWNGRRVHIVGIMKDFHSRSLHDPIPPLILALTASWQKYLSIKISTANIPATIDYIESTLKQFSPNYPYEFQFLDETLESAYRTEQEMGNILNALASLSIIIGCLGLLGLSSFTAMQKTREIGIRKIVGASVLKITVMFLQIFIKWVFLAVLISWPIAYFAVHKWLQNFAYRTNLSIWIFFLSGLAALLIAVLTVSYQTIKAARANPVESLRYE